MMNSSLLIGIIEAPMGLTVEDVFGNVVTNVTLIDFIRESYVSKPSAGQSDIHGDTGWWRLSNTTGNVYESMFNVDDTGTPIGADSPTTILRSVSTTFEDIFQGFTTNMSDITSGTVTLDDATKPSWFFGISNAGVTASSREFALAYLAPGDTNIIDAINAPLFSVYENNLVAYDVTNHNQYFLMQSNETSGLNLIDPASNFTYFNAYKGGLIAFNFDESGSIDIGYIEGGSGGFFLGDYAFTFNGTTIATIGPTSPGNATPQEWLIINKADGTQRFLPCF